MEKLSIIVPVYNIRNYLQDCMDSLIKQDYDYCEIILVDDGSTDGSSLLCDELAQTDERIRVIHKQNGGLPDARNTGLRVATGNYICFVDSDDVVAPKMYSSLIKKLEETNASVAICNSLIFNKECKIKVTKYKDEVIEYTSFLPTRFYCPALDSCWNRVFRAETIRKNNLWFEHKNIVAQEDYWFQVRLFSHINRIVTVSDHFYFYRERGSSITKSHSDGDITKRNLNFYALAKKYIETNTDRDVSKFLEYLIVNLFISSINNASEPSPYVIREIVNCFNTEPYLQQAISSDSIKRMITGSSLRDRYTRTTFWLLRHHLESVFAFIEAARLKRLRSNDRTSVYYD